MMMILLRTFLLFLRRAKNLIESKNERNPEKLQNMFHGFVDNVTVLLGFSSFTSSAWTEDQVGSLWSILMRF